MLGYTLDGKYRIERLLGTGGMGSVYAAADLRGGQTVAIKVIHKHLSEGRALLQRFEREARVAGSIDTEHIARCLDTGTDPQSGSPYMVLEYLIGEDLQHVLRRLGPLMPEVALRIVSQACLGVSKAHQSSVVHRDIKPANIFLAKGEDGVRIVKVLDFGVAKFRPEDGDVGASSSTAGGLTRTGSILGSPLYMSPEQARSVKNVDYRSDIWSLGVVLYQAVAGRTPYDHISGLGDLILALCSDLPPPVQQFAPWVAPEIAAIVDRALRIDPRERFQSADEMVAAMRPLLPHGIELRDEMLASLDDTTHDQIAPTYFRTVGGGPAPPPPAPTVVPNKAAITTGAPTSSDRRPETTGDAQQGAQSTQAGVATTGPGLPDTGDRRAPAAARRQVPTLAVALACVLAGGAGVYALTRSTRAPDSSGTAVALSAPPVTTTPAPPLAADGGSAPRPIVEAAPAPLDASSPAITAGDASAPVRPAPSGPMPSGAWAHTRPTAAPTVSAPKPAPVDYNSFGGRK